MANNRPSATALPVKEARIHQIKPSAPLITMADNRPSATALPVRVARIHQIGPSAPLLTTADNRPSAPALPARVARIHQIGPSAPLSPGPTIGLAQQRYRRESHDPPLNLVADMRKVRCWQPKSGQLGPRAADSPAELALQADASLDVYFKKCQSTKATYGT